MAKLIIDGLTMEQAETLADYFEAQGEQDCVNWFDEQGVESPTVDVGFKGSKSGQKGMWKKVDKENKQVTIICK